MNQSKSLKTPPPRTKRFMFRLIIAGTWIAFGLCLYYLLPYAMENWLDDDTSPRVNRVFLADLNSDGHPDAFLLYVNETSRVLLNDGAGHFTPHADVYQRSYALALGDINGDGQLEAVMNTFRGQSANLMCTGIPSGYLLAKSAATGAGQQAFALQDDDGDGVSDSFLVDCCKNGSVIYNYGIEVTPTPCLGDSNPNAVALGDLNGDGALDAFLAEGRGSSEPNQVWFNDGRGNFTDSGQNLGNARSLDTALADLDGDGDLDAVVANRGADRVWLNDGQGSFTHSGQRLSRRLTHSLFLADQDGDGDLDLLAAGETIGQVWLNNGAGEFEAGQQVRYKREESVAIADVTGDGLTDLFVAGVDEHQVWPGDGRGRFTPDPETIGRNRAGR